MDITFTPLFFGGCVGCGSTHDRTCCTGCCARICDKCFVGKSIGVTVGGSLVMKCPACNTFVEVHASMFDQMFVKILAGGRVVKTAVLVKKDGKMVVAGSKFDHARIVIDNNAVKVQIFG